MSRDERLQGILLHLLLLGIAALLAWLSLQHTAYWDWTESRRNSLSAPTLALLQRLESPLLITSFAAEKASLRRPIDRLLQRFHRAAPQWVEIRFLDPQLHPEQARRAGIQLSGELLLQYQGRDEKLRRLSEQDIGNAILRLLSGGQRWIAALSGHGERKLDGDAGHDLSQFAALLEHNGYLLHTLDPSISSFPDNLGLLLLAGPRFKMSEEETRRLQDYIAHGGRLLWLMDPDDDPGLDGLKRQLGFNSLPGVIVDANVADLGVDNPTIAMVSRYPEHPATRDFEPIALFPRALALAPDTDSPWQVTELLRTLPRSWNETGLMEGRISQEPEHGEQAGPLSLGLALERPPADGNGSQRILVIGDGDFLSNAFLDKAGNRDLGQRLVRWLMQEDDLLQLPDRALDDRHVRITQDMALLLGAGHLILLPLLLLFVAFWIRRVRSRP